MATKLTPAPAPAFDLAEQTPPAEAAQQILMHQAVAHYGEERDLVNQIMGQVQMANSFARFADVISLTKLQWIKESKAYRALAGQKGRDPEGREIADVGTFEGFCQALGLSRSKVDEDLRNLTHFGEEALKQLSAAGCGYRELRQFRRLPADSQEALIEAAKAGDKDGLLDLAEELIARQQKEKAELAEQLDEARADIEAKDDRAAKRERDIENLQKKLRQAKLERQRAEPDDIAGELRTLASAAALQVRADIGATGDDVESLQERIAALCEHAASAGGDGDEHHPFMGALIGELFSELRRVRDAFGLPIVNDHGAPDWQQGL